MILSDNTNNTNVDNFLRDTQALSSVSSESFETVMAIRKLFLDANPNLAEDIKYGGLVFLQSNVLIGGIFISKNHLSIEFSNGAQFDDPENLLDGKGKLRRHLKILNLGDIDIKKVNGFVKQAALYE